VRFGIGIRRRGYNIFAFGRHGSGKSTTIQGFLGQLARDQPATNTWAYVFNFRERAHGANMPRALRLPAATECDLCQLMERMVEDLLVELPAAFEGEAYSSRRQEVSERFEAQSREAFETLSKGAKQRGLTVVQGTEGIGILPLAESGEPPSPEAFRALPEDRQAKIRSDIEATQAELETAARSTRQLQRESRRALVALDREVASGVVDGCLQELLGCCGELPEVVAYLEGVKADILDHLELFRPTEEDDEPPAGGNGDRGGDSGHAPDDNVPEDPSAARARRLASQRLRRYAVNVLVRHEPGGGVPVVVESHPTLANLLGRIEYESRFGTLVTDFTHIKPGALHRANGGYLVLEAAEVLKQPYAWDALKRALRNEEIRIEAPGDDSSPATTITLEPEPIPLDCKVILIGEPEVYHLLHRVDPDFPELFKVAAEFGLSMPRTPEGVLLYSRAVATVAQREGLLPFNREAVARVVDHGARLAEDTHRLSTHFLTITDLLREADYWATERGAEVIGCQDVDHAIDARIRRMDLSRERIHEAYEREIVLLDTAGAAVGQVNGLTVVSRGDFRFGLPVRISARVRLGAGEVVNIEREVELSGPLHSKGVLILSGFLGGRYLPDEPLAMSASLTFEQSYSGVDGDSASSTELYALLSALSDLPISQSLAVTGSVNQAGEVQAIGGANEKIEGFFDICMQRGLTGDQGVLIPESNVQHLMLRTDVVEAVGDGKFHIYPVRHIDEGIELLTGRPAGERGEDGRFPPDSVNFLVEDRLRELAEKRRELTRGGDEGDGE